MGCVVSIFRICFETGAGIVRWVFYTVPVGLLRWARISYRGSVRRSLVHTRTDAESTNSSLTDIEVEQLSATADSEHATVTVTWQPPLAVPTRLVAHYELCFRPVRSESDQQTLRTDVGAGGSLSIVIARENGLKPLKEYVFGVRAVFRSGAVGKWSWLTCFVEWQCQQPYCRENRLENPNGDIHHFCRAHCNAGSQTTYIHITAQCITDGSYKSQCSAFTETNLDWATRTMSRSYNEGEWHRETTRHIDHSCKLPDCTNNRIELTEFCCRKHSREYAAQYCLFPRCIKRTQNDFCKSHEQQAIQTRFSTVVDIDPDSKVFKALYKQFCKDWAPAKGPCPDIGVILRVVNPAVSQMFQRYRKDLRMFRRGVEQYYHGTKLKCRINETLTFCCNTDCGVCGITKCGFDRQKIAGRSFQRFGNGFYCAPNSSKSHDYTKGPIHGMFLCNVAPGKKYKSNYDARGLQEPPEGCDSVLGKHSRKGSLNYDEIVVYDPPAICPCYIFLYA